MTQHYAAPPGVMDQALGGWRRLVRSSPIALRPLDDVLEAANGMLDVGLRCAPVVDGHQLAGVATVTQCARAVIMQLRDGAKPQWPSISAAMMACPTVVEVGTPTSTIADLFLSLDVCLLPVVQRGRYVGVVFPDTLLRVLLEEREASLFERLRRSTNRRLLNSAIRPPVGPALLARWRTRPPLARR